MIIDEKEMEGYKIQVSHKEESMEKIEWEVEKHVSERTFDNTSIGSDKSPGEAKPKRHWLFWRKS